MIKEYTNDLIEKLNSIAAFGGRVAATLGGTEADPALANIPVPCAWVVFQSSQNIDATNQKWQMMQLNFSVVVILDYSEGETDFLDNQLQLIDDCTQAVRGTLAAEQGSMLWSYDGCSFMEANTDRVLYGLNFSAPAAYAK